MLLCHCAFYLLLPSAVKYSINDNITVLIWHTANLLRFSKTTSILKIMVWVMRLFFPFNSVFSLSIFLKEAHFNSSVEIRFMEGGCFCKLALSVHLQELFSPRVLKRFLFFFLGFFCPPWRRLPQLFAIFYFVCAPLCNRWHKLMFLVDFSFFFLVFIFVFIYLYFFFTFF